MVGLLLALYVILVSVGIFFALNLNKKVVYDDLVGFLHREVSTKTKIKNLQRKSRRGKLKAALIKLQTQLVSQGKAPLFSVICIGALAAAVGGIVLALLINNYYLTVPLALIFGSFPFLYYLREDFTISTI